MVTKTTGAEFKRFYNDDEFWPGNAAAGEEAYHDDTLIFVNGVDLEDRSTDDIPDSAVVELDGGIVFNAKVGGKEPSFEAYFRRWKKKQSTVSFVVECKKEHAELVKKMVAMHGGRVL